MRIGNQDFPAGQGPYIVGVVNLSPESPNRDALAEGSARAVERARLLAAQGARIVDVGAQSSHFAAPLVSAEEECERLLPAVRALKEAGFLVSVDTWDARVIRAAARAGADLINDADGFQDPEVIAAVAESGLPVVVPFINGPNPRDLHPFDVEQPVEVMLAWFDAALERARRAGVTRVILDPGTGFAQPHLSAEEKEAFQRRVYPHLRRLQALGWPLLVALPRKPRRETTLALARMIVAGGADFLRAHDPVLAAEAIAAETGCRAPGGGGCGPR